MFFFSRGLVRTFSSSSTRRFRHFLDCSPWTNISWGCQHYSRTLLPTLLLDLVIHKNFLWRFIFFVFVLFLVTTFVGRLIYCLLPTLWLDFYCILFIITCVCRRYDRTSLFVILLEDSFDQSCSSTDLSAATASHFVATVHCREIATGLLSNNVGSTL